MPGEQTFKKSERLTQRPEFEKVLNRGRKIRVERICTIFVLPNDCAGPRLGIIASKKVGNAPRRNLAKRKIREVFRGLKNRIQPAVDIVIISGKDLVPLPLTILEKKIAKVLLALR